MRPEFARPWVRFPAGLRCVFSSDPAVSSSTFVGAEREENLISTSIFRARSTRSTFLLSNLCRSPRESLSNA